MRKLYKISSLCVALLSMLCAITLSITTASATMFNQQAQDNIGLSAEQIVTDISETEEVQAAQAPTGADIIGGQEARIGEFPWQVRMPTPGCGGSLIHREWVLTAAHCISQDMRSVVLGSHNLNRNENSRQVIAIESYVVHPNYRNLDNDIALLKLARPATLNNRVALIQLIAESGEGRLTNSGTTATVSGWGQTRGGQSPGSAVLRKVRIPIVSNQVCNISHSIRSITANMLCAGRVDRAIGSCHGDSGGPLSVYNGTRWKQVGIVSWGESGCTPNNYGVYTRVSRYIRWIKQYVPLGSSSVPPPSTSGDRYENDNISSRATTISTNGSRQTHNIHVNGDVDWLKFNTVRGREYVVETLNLGNRIDTEIWLFNPSNSSLHNDDISSSNRASRISFTAGQSGTYRIAVRQYNNSASGANTNYDIRVRTVTSAPSGDAYETDNRINQARSIGTNNGSQNHNFHARNDQDWVKFSVRRGRSYIIDTLNLGSRADTVIYLYDGSGNRLLSNDDYNGSRSRLRFSVNSNTTLYLMVKQYNGSVYGQNTGYTLRARTVNGYASSAESTKVSAALVESVEESMLDASAVVLHAVSPSSIHNRQAKSIILEGTGLTEGEVDIYLDDVLLTKAFVEKGKSISALVPVGMDPGTYDITLVDTAGERTTLSDGLVITGEPFDHNIYLPVIR